MTSRRARIGLDRRLTDESVPRSGPYKWPLPLLARLRELVERANRAGARTTQSELLAALLLTASAEPAELKRLVDALRTSLVREALIEDVKTKHLEFEARGPGRPRQS